MQPQRQWRLLLGLEGVAIDPAPATLAALQEGLRQIGRPLPPELSLDGLMHREFEEALEYLLGSDYERLGTSAAKRVGLHYREFRRYKGRVYAGIPELLETLSHQPEVETLLLSAWKTKETRQQLARYSLADAVDAIACREAHGCLGCRRKLAIDIANRAEPSDGQLVWVSDDPKDIVAAREHGILSIAALWGHSRRDEFTAAMPSLWAVEPQDVAVLLSQPPTGSASRAILMH